MNVISAPLVPANRRILLVDDNAAIHDDFRKILGEASDATGELDAAEALLLGESPAPKQGHGFELDSAFQGREALDLIQCALREGRPYAMAFMDVRMPPGLDGIETTSKIWELYPDLQVVICTAYSDYSWDEMMSRLGQSDRLVILKKPFDIVEVLQLACTMTEKWRLLQQARAQVADLEREIGLRNAELQRSEERFRLIAEHAGDLIAVVDAAENRLYNSPSYERVLGYAPIELEQTSPFAQIHPDDRQHVRDAFHEAFATGAGRVIEFRIQHKDGSWRVLESHASVVRRTAGEADQLVLVARDITQRKQAAEEHQRMELQLRQAQKLESIGQLAAGIAHEINTPTQFIGDNLRFIRDSFADLQRLRPVENRLLAAAQNGGVSAGLVAEVQAAREKADLAYVDEEIPKALDQALEGVERVGRIVRAMKEFSHPGVTEKQNLDLNRAIESTIVVSSNEWKYFADLVTELDPQLPAVPCLPGEFNQVILNLIVNAAHAIAEVVGEAPTVKGTITISTRRDGAWAEIRIRDTGAGIPEHARVRVFDPFFTTKEVGKGTGQGLAIAHSVIVDKHGGTIQFETELKVGTSFVIRLPLKAAGDGL
jgi:two-component system, NtrC family, sensor kinase